jgi:hypothetical protein
MILKLFKFYFKIKYYKPIHRITGCTTQTKINVSEIIYSLYEKVERVFSYPNVQECSLNGQQSLIWYYRVIRYKNHYHPAKYTA